MSLRRWHSRQLETKGLKMIVFGLRFPKDQIAGRDRLDTHLHPTQGRSS